MIRFRALLLAVLAFPVASNAAWFLNEIAGDKKLPRTYGIGIDYFSMNQPYALDSLALIDTGSWMWISGHCYYPTRVSCRSTMRSGTRTSRSTHGLRRS